MKKYIIIKDSDEPAEVVAEMCDVSVDNVIENKGNQTDTDLMLMVCDMFTQKAVLSAMMDENEHEDWLIDDIVEHLELQEEYYCIKQDDDSDDINKKLGDGYLVMELTDDKTLYGRPSACDLAAYIMANENKLSIMDLDNIGEYLKGIINN